MLVKVRNKATKQEQVITQKAYNLAKKRFEYVGLAPEGSDLNGRIAEVKNETILNQESPNLTATAKKEEEKGAEAVVSNAPKVAAKRGPKPKDKNQISSQAVASES